MKQCSIDGCESKCRARGWCGAHYQRWQAHGDPLGGGARYATPDEAFEARTEPLVWSSCIVWTGSLGGGGYGVLSVNGRLVKAHRYAWERVNGPILDGLVIDHRCFERSCVNVEHLRLATVAQNGANRSGALSGRDLPRGVTRAGRRYRAQIGHNGRNHYLGTFDTPEEASTAYRTRAAILFGEFAGGA